jgi:hypothetical protein
MKQLNHRVAVVTGGASGIGRGMAEQFAANGMKVMIADIEAGPREETVEALRATGAEVVGIHCDVASAWSAFWPMAKGNRHVPKRSMPCTRYVVAIGIPLLPMPAWDATFWYDRQPRVQCRNAEGWGWTFMRCLIRSSICSGAAAVYLIGP